MKKLLLVSGALALMAVGAGTQSPTPLKERIARGDPAKYREAPAVHGGAGTLNFTRLFNFNTLDTNLYFFDRGFIPPKGGIGAHFHNQCEEMFVILDGEAQFTVDGRTSVLKGPAGAPVRMGHSHAIYNHTDKPVEWMNINVSARRGVYDAFDLDDPRVGVQIDPIPVFMSMRLDRTHRGMRQVDGLYGGKGPVQYRRALQPSVFAGPWAYVDHLVVPPGSTVGPQTLADVAEFYYVMSGQGSVTVGSEKASIQNGDAVPIRLNETKTFSNSGTAPLEFLVVGVARDPERKFDVVPSPPPPARGGGGGRGNQ